MNNSEIFPEKDAFINRRQKERMMDQRGIVMWFTGLSGSGKSTLATGVEKKLHQMGILTQVLDGDKIRNGLNNNLGFTEEDRFENIRRIAEVSKLFCNCGVVTISAFISPTVKIREMAKNIVGQDDFLEIFVSTPIEECEKRDVKGLYKKARSGEIKNFTGISSVYETPPNADINIDTRGKTIDACVGSIIENVIQKIKVKVPNA